MLSIKLVNRESGRLRKRLRDISKAIDPNSDRMNRFRTEVKKIRVQDNIDMLTHRGGGTYAGEDRLGHDLAPPAESTLASRRGTLVGFVLAPRGLASRMITHFFVDWSRSGNGWRMVDGWKGIPWVIYHLQGCPKGSKSNQPNWSLPQRDVGGVSRKAWTSIHAAFAKLAKSILKQGSS